MPMKSNQEQLIHRISLKGISKNGAKLSNTPTEQCFMIYNGDKDIKNICQVK